MVWSWKSESQAGCLACRGRSSISRCIWCVSYVSVGLALSVLRSYQIFQKEISMNPVRPYFNKAIKSSRAGKLSPYSNWLRAARSEVRNTAEETILVLYIPFQTDSGAHTTSTAMDPVAPSCDQVGGVWR